MSEYSVMLEVFASTSVTVDADSVEEAMDLAALEASASICHHCSRKLNVSDVGEVLEVLGPDNEIAWERPENKRVAELEAELAEAEALLRVMHVEHGYKSIADWLARHGGQS